MDKNTREIPRTQWVGYLRKLAAQAEGTTVAVEVLSAELGDQALTERSSLRSITYVARPGSEALEIDLGEGEQIDHRVVAPRKMFAIEAESGAIECLEIEDGDGVKTLIRFERPLLIGEGTGVPDRMGSGLTAQSYMSSPVQTLPLGSSIAQALTLLERGDFRHLPIVDSNGRLRGILSDRELFLAKHERGIAPEDVTVDEMMTRSPFHVSPDTPIEEVALVMARRKYGCAVVVAGEKVVGILTTTDALRGFVELLAQRGTGAAPEVTSPPVG